MKKIYNKMNILLILFLFISYITGFYEDFSYTYYHFMPPIFAFLIVLLHIGYARSAWVQIRNFSQLRNKVKIRIILSSLMFFFFVISIVSGSILYLSINEMINNLEVFSLSKDMHHMSVSVTLVLFIVHLFFYRRRIFSIKKLS